MAAARILDDLQKVQTAFAEGDYRTAFRAFESNWRIAIQPQFNPVEHIISLNLERTLRERALTALRSAQMEVNSVLGAVDGVTSGMGDEVCGTLESFYTKLEGHQETLADWTKRMEELTIFLHEKVDKWESDPHHDDEGMKATPWNGDEISSCNDEIEDNDEVIYSFRDHSDEMDAFKEDTIDWTKPECTNDPKAFASDVDGVRKRVEGIRDELASREESLMVRIAAIHEELEGKDIAGSFSFISVDDDVPDVPHAQAREMTDDDTTVAQVKEEMVRWEQKRYVSPFPAKHFENSLKMEMLLIPKGTFMMGGVMWDDEKPRHSVDIGEDFYMAAHPVTQSQWEALMDYNPSRFVGGDKPVENVSWEEAKEFVTKLNEFEMTDAYRLPSEAEWEHACRAGSETEYYFGEYENDLDDYAWYFRNSNNKSHSVGQKKPNPHGLFDMHGNVWEWCEDNWSSDYSETPVDGSAAVYGDTFRRVARGGSWYLGAGRCRSAYRYGFQLSWRFADLGFRVVRGGA